MSTARELEQHRRRYAEELRELGPLRTEALVRAFATVPREDYLGPGPWQKVEFGSGYRETPDADPAHLYQNALFAIDAARTLNNGEPLGLARWFDALELTKSERVLHIGCGVGYYTAILRETVGPEGHVIGVEADPDLAARSRANLAHYTNCQVFAADGSTFEAGPRDAVFVNAGATHPARPWLDCLAPGGRLLFPLTVGMPNLNANVGGGQMLLVTRRREGNDSARFVSPVGIFHCIGARCADEEEALRAAFSRAGEAEVRSLRWDRHQPDPACWLHTAQFCLTRKGP